MRTRVRRQCYYDARANDVNLRDITSSEKNANHLRALRDEQADNFCKKLSLMTLDYNDSREHDFVIREGDDLGWLGYFIRRSKRIEQLSIHGLPEERQLDALIEGIAHNQSIHDFHFATDDGYQSFERVDCILKSNKSISDLGFSNMNTGSERAQNIALSALGQVQPNSMKTFMFHHNTISDKVFADAICGALGAHPQLDNLYLFTNDIGRNGCRALGSMLSSWHAPSLKYLDLGNNSIDDRGLQSLVGGMINCCNLEIVKLSGNTSITAAGLRSLSTLFQSENCPLKYLWIEKLRIGDDGAAALAEGLVGNNSLKQLLFDVDIAGITEVGWSAFSKLLCDTSSINNTYLSNHTIEWIGESDDRGAPKDVAEHLAWTTYSYSDEYNVAIWKILTYHREIDIEPLLQWKLKLLPLLVTWFESKRSLIMPRTLARQVKDLGNGLPTAVYKFIRGMPLLIIDGFEGSMISGSAPRKRRLNKNEAQRGRKVRGKNKN